MKGTRGRQDDLRENLPFGRAIGAADLQHRPAHVANAGIGVDGDGKDRDRNQDGHLAGKLQPRPQNDQRNERNARDGVERVDERVEDVFQHPPLRHENAEKDSDHHGEHHADQEWPQRLDQRLLQRPAADERHCRRKDGAWRRHEDRIHAAPVIFPDHQKHGDRDSADGVGGKRKRAQARRCAAFRRRHSLSHPLRVGFAHASLLSMSRSSARQLPNRGCARTSPLRRSAASGESMTARRRPGAALNTKMRSER